MIEHKSPCTESPLQWGPCLIQCVAVRLQYVSQFLASAIVDGLLTLDYLGEALAHLVSDTKSLLKGHLEEASLRAQGTSDLVVNGLHEDEAKWSRFVEGQDNLRAGALTSSRNFAASASGDMDSISDRKRRAETLS